MVWYDVIWRDLIWHDMVIVKFWGLRQSQHGLNLWLAHVSWYLGMLFLRDYENSITLMCVVGLQWSQHVMLKLHDLTWCVIAIRSMKDSNL